MRDRQAEVRYYRRQAGSTVAVRFVIASDATLDQLEFDPGIGSPALGTAIGIPGLRSWRVTGFPLLWFYFERDNHLDVARLLGERQDISTILTEAL